MGDLARLGMRIESEEVATADKRLDDFTASAERADKANSTLTGSSKRVSSAMMDLVAAMQKDVARLVELQRGLEGASSASDGLTASSKTARKSVDDLAKATKSANDNIKLYSGSVNDMNTHVQLFRDHQKKLADAHELAAKGSKLQTHELLNLSRQASDVGVQLAMLQNPLLILIQQGPQIADVFQSAAARGVTFSAALKSIWVEAAPILAVLAPIAVVAGAIATVFAVGAQQINKDNKGLINSLHLTEDQLENVKNKTVTMGDVMKGTWNAAAGALTKAFAPEIKATKKFFNDLYEGAIDFAIQSVKNQVGTWVGGYEAIRATWRMLPAALGDIVYSTANVIIRGVELSVNTAITLINGLVDRANGITAKLGLPQLGRLDGVSFGGIDNPYAGAAAKAGEVAGKAFAEGAKKGAGYVDAALAAIEAETLKAYRARVLKEAGKAAKGRKDPLEESELAKSAKLFEWASKARGEAMDDEWKRVERLKDANTKLIDAYERQVEQAKKALDVAGSAGVNDARSAVQDVREKSDLYGLERRKAAFDQINEWERQSVITHREAEAAKAGIDKLYAQQRLTTVGKFFGDLSALSQVKNKELAAIGKAAAMVQATIDGVLAVQKALASYPPPINFAMAAAVGAVAAVNVAKIAGFKKGGWTGNGSADEVAGVTHGQEFVVKAGPAAANREMLEALNAGRPAPTPARPSPRPANDGGGEWRLVVSPNPLFDAHLERVSAGVAAPIAQTASETAATRAVATTADQYTRRNVKKLY